MKESIRRWVTIVLLIVLFLLLLQTQSDAFDCAPDECVVGCASEDCAWFGPRVWLPIVEGGAQ